MDNRDVMTVYVSVTFTPRVAVISVNIVGSRTGEENRNTITVPNRIFLFNKFTTIGIVEQEQNGVIKANTIAMKELYRKFDLESNTSSLSYGKKL